jgi:hypothetical protein
VVDLEREINFKGYLKNGFTREEIVNPSAEWADNNISNRERKN